MKQEVFDALQGVIGQSREDIDEASLGMVVGIDTLVASVFHQREEIGLGRSRRSAG